MTEQIEKAPRVFISYSWSSQEHKDWVISLAEKLMANGVEVIADFWDLKEGQEKYSFMESMVTDKEIKKVLVICDKRYAQKADSKQGGVGTESTIISTETYSKVDQVKFIPVVVEHDENGEAYVPIFLKSRIYINLSSEESADDFETLIRAIFDKPLYKKPAVGKMPSFLLEDFKALPTSGKFQLLKDAFEKDKSISRGILIDWLEEASLLLESEYITNLASQSHDEQIVDSINRMKPFKDQFCDVVSLICKYGKMDYLEEFFPFYERSLKLYNSQENVQSYMTYQFDNIRFIVYELFLHMMAILFRYEKFVEANIFIDRTYIYAPTNREKVNRNFDVFSDELDSLDRVRNTRLNLRKVSLSTQMMNDRADYKGINFEKICEVDYILWFRSRLKGIHWFPITLIYMERSKNEMFLRAESAIYFEKIKPLLAVNNLEDLKVKFSKIKADTDLSQWRARDAWHPLPLESSLNLPNLCSK